MKPKPAFFIILAVAVAALYLAIGVIGLNDYVFLEFDSPIYIILTRGLSLGEGFSDISVPGSPPECSRYPLYPLVLFPVLVFFPLSVPAAKMVTHLCGFAAAICFFFYLKKSAGSWWAFAGAILLAFNPFALFRYSLQPLSEYLYVLIVCAFFLWYFSSARREGTPPARIFLPAVIFFTAAAMWKENGLALPFAYLIYRWRFREARRRDYILVLIPLLLSVAWMARNAALYRVYGVGWPSHLQEIFSRFSAGNGVMDASFLFQSLLHNSTYYFLAFPRLILSSFFLGEFMFGDCFPALIPLPGRGPVFWLVASTVYLLAIFGWINFKLRRERFILGTWAALYLATIIVFPASEIRMAFVLLPVFIFFLIHGVRTAAARVSVFKVPVSLGLALLSAVFIAHSLLTAVLTTGDMSYNGFGARLARAVNFRSGQCQWRYREAGQWLRENTFPDEIVIADSSSVYLFSERRVVLFDARRLPDVIRDDASIRYLALKGSFGLPFVGAGLRMNPRFRFHRKADFGNVLIYEISAREEKGVSLSPPREEYLGAIRRAEKELKHYPGDPYLNHEIGMLYFALRDFEKALGYLERSVELQPRAITLTLDLARCYTLAGRYDEAEETLRRSLVQEVFQRSYDRIQGLLEINRLYRKLSKRMDPAGRKELLVRIAAVNDSLGNRVSAAHNLKEAWAYDPEDAGIPRILREHFGITGLKEK